MKEKKKRIKSIEHHSFPVAYPAISAWAARAALVRLFSRIFMLLWLGAVGASDSKVPERNLAHAQRPWEGSHWPAGTLIRRKTDAHTHSHTHTHTYEKARARIPNSVLWDGVRTGLPLEASSPCVFVRLFASYGFPERLVFSNPLRLSFENKRSIPEREAAL